MDTLPWPRPTDVATRKTRKAWCLKRPFKLVSYVVFSLVLLAFFAVYLTYSRQQTTIEPNNSIASSKDSVSLLHTASERLPSHETKVTPTSGVLSISTEGTVTTGAKDTTNNPSLGQSHTSKHTPSTPSSSKVEVKKEKNHSSTQAVPSSQSPTEPVKAVNPKVWKFEPPTSNLSTRPPGTMHPDSLNPKRTYNTEPPNLPHCHSEGEKVVTIYVESHDQLTRWFGSLSKDSVIVSAGKCSIPDGAMCKMKKNETQADAVFRFVEFANTTWPLRYCQNQILIALNSEALREVDGRHQQLDLADVRIDHFLTSDAIWFQACNVVPKEILNKKPPISYDLAKRTKTVAMFLSNCRFKFRTDYLQEVMKYIKVDSYGKCFHNIEHKEETRLEPNWRDIESKTLESYRMVITFENMIQEDYITEKIWVAYSSGVIPVYLGPPDIYNWAPGNHTFIDPRDFAGPKELADYMQRVAEDDDLYRYHTSNFDWDRTRRMLDKYCRKANFLCNMCQLAYNRKSQRTLA